MTITDYLITKETTDYSEILSLPVEAGQRTVRLALSGGWENNRLGQVFFQLQGDNISNVVFRGGYVSDGQESPVDATILTAELQPSPVNENPATFICWALVEFEATEATTITFNTACNPLPEALETDVITVKLASLTVA